MAQPFVGEIRMFAGNFAPAGWALCDGQLLPIAENEVLFALIGTTYGGDGQSTFALPDLRGRIPIHNTTTHPIGQFAGAEQVLLAQYQTGHTHSLLASSDFASPIEGPSGNLLAVSATQVYAVSPPPASRVPMSANAVSTLATGGFPHNNIAPFLCVTFIISLFGIYPVQS